MKRQKHGAHENSLLYTSCYACIKCVLPVSITGVRSRLLKNQSECMKYLYHVKKPYTCRQVLMFSAGTFETVNEINLLSSNTHIITIILYPFAFGSDRLISAKHL